MASAGEEAIVEARITQTKPPSAWTGTPAEDVVDLASLTEAMVVFQARRASGFRWSEGW